METDLIEKKGQGEKYHKKSTLKKGEGWHSSRVASPVGQAILIQTGREPVHRVR
jgi:hypothetical protein